MKKKCDWLLIKYEETFGIRQDCYTIHILISEYILDFSGKKNEKYIQAINQLRRIN